MVRPRVWVLCGVALVCVFVLELALRTPPLSAHDEQRVRREEDATLLECLAGTVWVGAGGRLGNVFIEWASALGVARALRRQLLVDERMVSPLRRTFAALPGDTATLREFFYRHDQRTPNGSPCADALHDKDLAARARPWPGTFDPFRNSSDPVLIPMYANLAEPIALVKDEIRLNTRFHAPVQRRAQDTLTAVRAQAAAAGLPAQGNQLLFIGVHARRGDYMEWMRRRMNARVFADEAYFVRAVKAMLETETGTTRAAALILASEDMAWARKTLAPALNRAFASAPVPARAFPVASGSAAATAADLALLAACNRSVIAYGTFGMTAALLAGGATVAFDTGVAWYGSTQLAAALADWTLVK